MPESERAFDDQLTLLLDRVALTTPDSLASLVGEAGVALGWAMRILLVDYAQRRLVPLPVPGRDLLDGEEIDSSLAGRAFRTVAPVSVHREHDHRVLVPLLDGAERLGVLEITLPAITDPADAELLNHIGRLAHLIGHLVASKSQYGDAFHLVRAAQRRSVAAELVWSLLPPLTMACERMVVSGLLEPAERVAGDVFDYAVHDNTANIAIFDATGHNLHSAVIGSLALAAYRNGRRQQVDMASIASRIDETLIDYAQDTYATGILAQLDLTSGTFRYINAGHVEPLLIRDGHVVKSLHDGRRILLGFANQLATVAEERLQDGDTIVLYTDGVIEARDSNRQFFGLERFVGLLEQSAADQQPAPETLRKVVHRLLEHQRGLLQDDASIVLIQWGGQAGAQQRRICAE